jgi:Xaa-Pro aminopeptidase
MPPSPDLIAARLAAARARVAAADHDALLVSAPANVRYLVGIAATAGLILVHRDGVAIVSDARYVTAFEAAARTLPETRVVLVSASDSYEAVTGRLMAEYDIGALGVEADHMTLARAAALRRAVDRPGFEIRESHAAIERLRMVKDRWEQGVLREAGARLAQVAACILPKVSAGQTERQVAWEIELAVHDAGFDRLAFEPIVASGPNGARPHHRAGDRRLADGDLVVVDFGGVLDGYAVDMTRTVALGTLPAEHRQWIGAVAAAQRAAVEAARPGVLPSAIDAAARGVLAEAGLAERFVHGTGHGLGLEVHERPTIGPRGDQDGPVAAGMVFTVEPGVYTVDRGGVRIEDDVLVTPSGVERLTGAPAAFEAHGH